MHQITLHNLGNAGCIRLKPSNNRRLSNGNSHRVKSCVRQLGALASVLSNTSTFRVCALNSTPTKWIGSPR